MYHRCGLLHALNTLTSDIESADCLIIVQGRGRRRHKTPTRMSRYVAPSCEDLLLRRTRASRSCHRWAAVTRCILKS